jgi:hypothetical protein
MTNLFESLIAFDDSLFITINSAHTAFFDIFFQIITFCRTALVVAPVLLFIVYRTIPKKQRSRILIFGIVSINTSGIINQGIKSIVHRPRPVSYFISETQAQTSGYADKSCLQRAYARTDITAPVVSIRACQYGICNSNVSCSNVWRVVLDFLYYGINSRLLTNLHGGAFFP